MLAKRFVSAENRGGFRFEKKRKSAGPFGLPSTFAIVKKFRISSRLEPTYSFFSDLRRNPS